MIIGIDIDEVLANQLDSLIKFYHETSGKLVRREDFHTQYWPDVLNLSLQEAQKLDHDFKSSTHFDNIEPIENAIESVNKLIKNNKIIIITSRPVIFKEKTDNWLRKHFKDLPMQIIHSADYQNLNKTMNKAQICKNLGIKLMIEDQDRYALECAEEEIKVILFDYPWNKNLNHRNVIRVKNWLEALKEIDEVEHNKH